MKTIAEFKNLVRQDSQPFRLVLFIQAFGTNVIFNRKSSMYNRELETFYRLLDEKDLRVLGQFLYRFERYMHNVKNIAI